MAKTVPYILRWSRIIVAILSIGLLTGVLVSYGMTIPHIGAWLAGIQFIPAAISFSLATVIGLLLVTLVFGRVYCSTICPLGIYQDFFSRVSRMFRKRDNRAFHYSPPLSRWRNMSLFVLVVSLVLGISAVVAVMDPYSVYSRACVYVVKPVWGYICNIFAVTPVRIASASLFGILLSLVLMGLVGMVAAAKGRLVCNTICPVGTTLGYVSRYSVFHIDIDTDKCTQCRACEYVCKSTCIDLVAHVVDSSRCVDCFDCLTVCHNDAIHYTWSRHQLSIPLMMRTRTSLAGSTAGMSDAAGMKAMDSSAGQPLVGTHLSLDRRAFLATGLIIATAPAISAVKKRSRLVGGLLEGQNGSTPAIPVTPPGVFDRQEFLERCTGCGLCISHCKTGVLRPSTTQYGLLRALHPVKDYDMAACDYSCTRCTKLCPTGALHPLTIEEKKHNSIGIAKVNVKDCISWANDFQCGRCADSCPSGAITMIRSGIPGRGLWPDVDIESCIGCGACQYVCPSRPVKAIIVNGTTT